MNAKRLYRIAFLNGGKLYEIYARSVSQGELYGFIEIEEIVFGEKSAVVVDPAEERLKTEFAGVRRSYIPLHAVVRIDEVDKQGTARISAAGEGKITPFPGAFYGPGKPTESGDN
jgi:hypothetical protein